MTEATFPLIDLTIPAEMLYRPVAMRAVEEGCRTLQALAGQEDEGFRHQLLSAFGEAFNNVIIHGYEGGTSGESVHVRLWWEDGGASLEIRDRGKAFDVSTVKEPDLAALPESGMGFFIMRSFVDDIGYTAGEPNVLRLRKNA